MRLAFNDNTSTMDKSRDTCICAAFFSLHMPNPSQIPQAPLDRVSRIFRFLTLYRVGGGRTARTFLFQEKQEEAILCTYLQ